MLTLVTRDLATQIILFPVWAWFLPLKTNVKKVKNIQYTFTFVLFVNKMFSNF